ncbi:hypothetical protein PN499_18785 [Kamptonema animale CS-326]|uniref:DUF6745 domain-containing protein n=1 Tax=Kamptonema animale TaxID=92934 RepID=UPI00232DE1CD|nr:hypothetical protein [Kamptonema animale]MDB9513243.1 hypothetical protein [Kamptonema animale CS-326]
MSETKIDKLTPEQEALIPVYLEKWRQFARSTVPINREKATEVVKSAYALMNLKNPEIIFYDSPYLGFKNIPSQPVIQSIIKLRFELSVQLIRQLYKQLSRQARRTLGEKCLVEQGFYEQQIKLRNKLENQLENQRHNQEFWDTCIWSDSDASWAVEYDFGVSVLNCNLDQKKWKIYQGLVKECGLIIMLEKTCIICDRPRILCFDNQHRLHAEGTPAIQFADGYSLYSYHGVTLPEKYGKLHPHQWQSQWLLEEENAELRRVLIQGIGYSRICQELEAVELDTWREYSLLRIDKNIDLEPINMLKMTCPSTGHIHFLRVPPNLKSARKAIKWVNWGVDAEDFSVQT